MPLVRTGGLGLYDCGFEPLSAETHEANLRGVRVVILEQPDQGSHPIARCSKSVHVFGDCGTGVACGDGTDRVGKPSFSQLTVNAITSAKANAPMTR
jgi:hypothetical protein